MLIGRLGPRELSAGMDEMSDPGSKYLGPGEEVESESSLRLSCRTSTSTGAAGIKSSAGPKELISLVTGFSARDSLPPRTMR
jgi:hypothetical protein